MTPALAAAFAAAIVAYILGLRRGRLIGRLDTFNGTVQQAIMASLVQRVRNAARDHGMYLPDGVPVEGETEIAEKAVHSLAVYFQSCACVAAPNRVIECVPCTLRRIVSEDYVKP